MNKILYVSLLLFLAGITFAQPKDILINWECDMEIEILSGRYNTADTVAARGDFNGWGRHDLVPNPINTNVYVSEVPDTAFSAVVGDTIVNYKFFYTPNSWEGGDNKIYVVTQSDYDAGECTIARPFNDGTLATVTNQATEVLFTVDCNGAISAINNQPFPSVNTVHIAGGTPPLQWPDLGWPDAQIDRMIPMYDDGTNGDETAGDKIFSAVVTFPAYTVFQIQFKYGINYGDAVNNGGGNDNENAIGANHVIDLFSSAWYCRVDNVFGTMGNHSFATDVNEVSDNIPSAYNLEQNYPNPFNPSTTINFSIPVEGFVTLDIYNAIGQKVASLINETKSAGNYAVDFNASTLTSGIYFYKISAGSFTETKKMILMK
jgi:hypothetical protein